MSIGICCVPVSSLRKETAHRSEIVTQVRFGEYIEILNNPENGWVSVSCCYDGYMGYMSESHFEALENLTIPLPENILVQNITSQITYDGAPMHIPLASNLNLPQEFISKHNISYPDKNKTIHDAPIIESLIKELSNQYLNTTYLWGGRSIFGIDCSGFAQSVFKFLNVPLLRDASLQATQGTDVGFLQEVICGDLAFFDNEEGKVTHVGIMLNPQEIIHASGKVRIDSIDSKGIINRDTGKRTHNLRLIKRYFTLDPNQ